jgi:hypothetical protein
MDEPVARTVWLVSDVIAQLERPTTERAHVADERIGDEAVEDSLHSLSPALDLPHRLQRYGG